MAAGFALLGGIVAGGALLGMAEKATHRRAQAQVPLRIHVNGTRGKTTVTRYIAALMRGLGRKTVAKTTGTEPLFIDLEGEEQPWPRRGGARVHELAVFIRRAARLGADVAVAECMAVEPVLQSIAERKLVRAHIGVITNVRTDHLEQMGSDLEQIARSLANTIPRGGVLVTGDERFYPLFSELAAPLGTKVVLATPGETDNGRGPRAENLAIARTVARLAGFSREQIDAVSFDSESSSPGPVAVPLPEPAMEGLFVDAWAVNDPESYAALIASDRIPAGNIIPLFNHRSDRPLRTVVFARVFAAEPSPARLLVTGEPGARRLFAKYGIAPSRIVPLPFPPDARVIARAVEDIDQPIVIGCGNARGVSDVLFEVRPDTAAEGDGTSTGQEGPL